ALEEQLDTLTFPQDVERAFSLYMRAYAERENAYFSIESGQRRDKAWVSPTLEEFISRPDEGGYAAVALRFIRAARGGQPCRMVLSVPNNGAIQGLADDDVVEVTCRIDQDGAHPVPIGEISAFQLQQLQRIKSFERGTIRAILERDEAEAARALYLHPLVNDLQIAADLSAAFFRQYQQYLDMDLR
ncbi:MAG: 6-phospho-beta-glucosidase, partial [Clostridiaceae bacterium]